MIPPSQPLSSISTMLSVEGSSFYGLLRDVAPQALPIGELAELSTQLTV